MTPATCFCESTLMNARWWSLSPGTYKFAIQLCAWVAQNSPTNSVSWNIIRELAGNSRKARRLIAELLSAGSPVEDHGILVASTDDSWVVCDSPFQAQPQRTIDVSKRAEAARQAGLASAAARKARTGSAQPGFSTEPKSGVHKVVRNKRSNARSGVPENGSNEPVRTEPLSPRAPQSPEESQPEAAAAKDLSGGARETARSQAAAATASPISEKVSCPKDLSLSDDQLERLRADGVPDYAVSAGVSRFMGKAGEYEPRSFGAWRNSLFTAVQGMWMDPKQRPKSPDSFNKPGPAKTASGREISEYTTLDGRKVRGAY